MSEPLILSGKDVSQSVYKSLLNRISILKDQNITPGLAVVIVGEDPASQIYVRSKTKKFKQLNLNTESFKLLDSTSEEELLKLIHALNENDQFHGILVQLPLPKQIDTQHVLETIDPKKMWMDSILKMPACFPSVNQDSFPAHQKGSCAFYLTII